MSEAATTFDIMVPVIPVLIACGAIGFWFLITSVLRRMAGMSGASQLRELARSASDRSGWSSGRIGIVSFGGCLQVLRTQRGFLLRIMPLFGIGYRFIPDEEIQEVRSQKGFFMGRQTTIIARSVIVMLRGSAAQFVLDQRADASPPGFR